MTSFINKKITPILIILTTLLIIASISSASAVLAFPDPEISLTYDKNLKEGAGVGDARIVSADKDIINITVKANTIARGILLS